MSRAAALTYGAATESFPTRQISCRTAESRTLLQTCSQDLVSDKETSSVVELLELVHDRGETVKLCLIPCWGALVRQSAYVMLVCAAPRSYSVNLSIEGVQVDKQVDASVGEGSHAAGVVSGGIDVVDANGVRAQRLHEVGVELALVVVDERVVWDQLVCDTWDVSIIDAPVGFRPSFCTYP